MPYDALRSILPATGWSADRLDTVQFTSDTDPILPTPFRIGVAGAATLAATGLAAADLWQLRGGRQQKVGVDVRQATASLRSTHYLKVGDGHVSSERNAIMGFYPTKDGRWSYVHANFPNHRAAALKVLGCEENRDAVTRAVSTWNAADLEEAIIAAKGAGGMVRTKTEWADHPQAAAIAALPLMEIVRIGDSAPEPLPEGTRPLSGIRVVDVTRVLAGPTCARTLAEHGAEVMKISAPHLPNLGYQEFDTGHGKLSTYLDLRQQQDVDTLRALVRDADVFSQGYRPGTLDCAWSVPSGTCRAPARPRLCLAMRLWPYRPMGIAPRLRHGHPERQRHYRPARRGIPRTSTGSTVLSGISDRLLHRLPDGDRGNDRFETPRGTGRQLAGEDFAGTGGEVDRRPGRGPGRLPAHGASRIFGRGTRSLVDGQPDAVRPTAASQAGRPTIRNAPLLGSAFRSPWLSPTGLARARGVERRSPPA